MLSNERKTGDYMPEIECSERRAPFLIAPPIGCNELIAQAPFPDEDEFFDAVEDQNSDAETSLAERDCTPLETAELEEEFYECENPSRWDQLKKGAAKVYQVGKAACTYLRPLLDQRGLVGRAVVNQAAGLALSYAGSSLAQSYGSDIAGTLALGATAVCASAYLVGRVTNGSSCPQIAATAAVITSAATAVIAGPTIANFVGPYVGPAAASIAGGLAGSEVARVTIDRIRGTSSATSVTRSNVQIATAQEITSRVAANVLPFPLNMAAPLVAPAIAVTAGVFKYELEVIQAGERPDISNLVSRAAEDAINKMGNNLVASLARCTVLHRVPALTRAFILATNRYTNLLKNPEIQPLANRLHALYKDPTSTDLDKQRAVSALRDKINSLRGESHGMIASFAEGSLGSYFLGSLTAEIDLGKIETSFFGKTVSSDETRALAQKLILEHLQHIIVIMGTLFSEDAETLHKDLSPKEQINAITGMIDILAANVYELPRVATFTRELGGLAASIQEGAAKAMAEKPIVYGAVTAANNGAAALITAAQEVGDTIQTGLEEMGVISEWGENVSENTPADLRVNPRSRWRSFLGRFRGAIGSVGGFFSGLFRPRRPR